MIKILKIPANDDQLKTLYRNIVTFNNSQNAINEKSFVALRDIFRRIQAEFEWKGFLVCIKQSDKNTFINKYKSITTLLDNNAKLIYRFGLTGLKKTGDFLVNLEKLLQTILAFISTPQDAIQNKSKLLKNQSMQNTKVVEFIKNPDSTVNDLINLYLLYLRAEQEKKNSSDGKTPNPFYLIYCFAHYECQDSPAKITQLLDSQVKIDALIKKYNLTLKRYYTKWVKRYTGKEYNDMIKAPIDIELLDECKIDVEELLALK